MLLPTHEWNPSRVSVLEGSINALTNYHERSQYYTCVSDGCCAAVKGKRQKSKSTNGKLLSHRIQPRKNRSTMKWWYSSHKLRHFKELKRKPISSRKHISIKYEQRCIETRWPNLISYILPSPTLLQLDLRPNLMWKVSLSVKAMQWQSLWMSIVVQINTIMLRMLY